MSPGCMKLIGANVKSSHGIQEALVVCVHALRSYQYGNIAPELAKSVADFAEAELAKLSEKVPIIPDEFEGTANG